jgi:peroxiredoxin
VLVRGKAHASYAGKLIQLYAVTDGITGNREKQSQDTIGADGYFELNFQARYTQPVFFKIGNVVTQLYVEPDFVYGITIPELEIEQTRSEAAELPVNIGVVGADSTELNALIFDYQQQYNKIFLEGNTSLSGQPAVFRPAMFHRADSLQKLCYERYKNIKNDYFRSYVIYSIASINASVSRGENYLIGAYILNRPIQYNHYEYMQFFNASFKGYLNTIATHFKGHSLYHIINTKADYPALLDFVRQDKLLKSDSLRELVILKNLWDFYFSIDFAPEAVENIVSQLDLQTKIKEHKKIASTMLAYFNKMQPGSQAPGFSARNKEGTMSSLSNFKNRWIYLNFFSTKNEESLKEMPKIAAMKKKFGDKIVFVSVCLDDSLKTYQNYIKANPKFDWPIWFSNERSLTKTAKENYSVVGTEAYFLINNFGYLAQSPALAPSQGIEFKLNTIFKIRQKNTKTGIR